MEKADGESEGERERGDKVERDRLLAYVGEGFDGESEE